MENTASETAAKSVVGNEAGNILGNEARNEVEDRVGQKTNEKKSVVRKLRHEPSRGTEWLAKIIGKDKIYGLNREFFSFSSINWSYNGNTGWTTYIITKPGIYEENCPEKGRRFFEVDNDMEEWDMSKEEVYQEFMI
ncbi:hypothetical protein [uncultured archaeal virus]|uniref:Uncharacterized protein n=1 Tax=uncultured archaeal virus TaxID=1960247 RepID=A0A8B0LNJ4_9VIRU|nr:hypothetical protein [uncultured archaeal virus]